MRFMESKGVFILGGYGYVINVILNYTLGGFHFQCLETSLFVFALEFIQSVINVFMAFYYLCPLSEIKKIFFIFWIMRILYERKCPREEKKKKEEGEKVIHKFFSLSF